ncbi:MAG: endonuclease/exonuclease/phosphatase family protein [Vicinamibacterales bacterium]
MRLICWNLHAVPLIGVRVAQRLKAAAAAIDHEAADVVMLQEIWTAEAFHVIQQSLGGNYTVMAGENGAGRNCGGLLTLLRRERWQNTRPAAFTRFTVAAPAWKFWQGDGLFRKGVLAVTTEHVASGRRMVFLNTHLQSQYGYFHADGVLRARQAYVAERVAQLRDLEAVARRYSDLLIVGGDFNTTPDEWPDMGLPHGWQELTAQLRMTGCLTYIEHTGPHSWYDYVFAQPGDSECITAHARLIENTAVDVPFSDHHGLVVELGLAPAQP